LINYVQERLHQNYLDLVIRQEQQEYHKEGLEWNDIEFPDNIEICNLLEGKNPLGILFPSL
jgi:myosin heavy subunit